MGLGTLLKLVALIVPRILAGPYFTLIYPVYASIQAIESNSNSNNQQCLTYWVLFSLSTLLEIILAKVLQWLPFWPYAKGIAACFLLLPYLGGATYVYEHFIRPCLVNPETYLWFSPKKGIVFSSQDDFLVEAKKFIEENGSEALEKLIIGKEHSRDLDPGSIDGELPRLVNPNNAQKEWICVLCLVSTTSKRCLMTHLVGKKHKAEEKLLEEDKMAKRNKGESSSLMLKRPNAVDLMENINQVTEAVLKTWTIRWCRWEKPEMGWTKLNTDGSIDRKKAGLGGLLRDYMGNPICGFVSKAPRDEIFSLELRAVWRGLLLALGQGIEAIWVESDSLGVVNIINKVVPYRPNAGSCLMLIWTLLTKFEKYKVTHSWREANRAADHLAKMDLYETDIVIWPVDFPERLHDIIKEDAQGMIYPRVNVSLFQH